MEKYVRIDKWLYRFTILFLVMPILLWLVFWFKPIVAIPCILLLTTATFLVFRRFKPLKLAEYRKIFNKKKMLIFAILIIVINILSGAGGIFPQNWDYHGRNAIYRDLITYDWPVTYDYTSADLAYEHEKFGDEGLFSYYFAWWLPGALIGKMTNFTVANIFILAWQTIGVGLFFYLVCRLMRNIKYRYFWIFLAFGGLNVIGYFIVNFGKFSETGPLIGSTHIDPSMLTFDLSTLLVQIFWVFNQSIPAWLATMLFLQNKDYGSAGYFLAILLPFAPFPSVGLFVMLVCYILFGKNLDQRIAWQRVKKVLSPENIMACISILPIAYLFMINSSKKGNFIVDSINNGSFAYILCLYILFVILEFLVYIVMMNRKNFRELLMCFIFFAIVPTFYIGTGRDVGTRTTIPFLILMYIWVCRSLDTIKIYNTKIYKRQIALIVILTIASVTNFNEIYRAIEKGISNLQTGESNMADDYQTFATFKDKECDSFITNFVVKNDPDNALLQWLIRK